MKNTDLYQRNLDKLIDIGKENPIKLISFSAELLKLIYSTGICIDLDIEFKNNIVYFHMFSYNVDVSIIISTVDMFEYIVKEKNKVVENSYTEYNLPDKINKLVDFLQKGYYLEGVNERVY